MKKFVDKIKWTTRRDAADDMPVAKPRKRVNTSVFRDDVKAALEVLGRGGVILYPTDTVWGLGCDASNEAAVQRIYEIKQRADSKALITLVDSEAKVEYYVPKVPPVAWDVMELNDRPTTIVYDGARNLAPNLIAEDGSVGIRVTNEEFSKELCLRFRRAIVSTSANVSGQPAPQCFAEISQEIIDAVDYVVTYRQKERRKAKPSTIIKLGPTGEVKVIRK